MQQVRDGKKAAVKKGVVKKVGGTEQEVTKGGEPAGEGSGAGGEGSNPPAYVFTQTNNNRKRALDAAQREREREEAAAAPKLSRLDDI